jgi:hypothetical protein
MPMTRQERSVYMKQWRLDNPLTDEQKIEIKCYKRQLQLNKTDEQKEADNAYNRQWRIDNPAVVLKIRRICHWKKRGVVCDDFDSLHDWYLSQDICQICSVVLTTGDVCSTRRVIDHCHITGEVRGIICFGCNVRLPKQK